MFSGSVPMILVAQCESILVQSDLLLQMYNNS